MFNLKETIISKFCLFFYSPIKINVNWKIIIFIIIYFKIFIVHVRNTLPDISKN